MLPLSTFAFFAIFVVTVSLTAMASPSTPNPNPHGIPSWEVVVTPISNAQYWANWVGFTINGLSLALFIIGTTYYVTFYCGFSGTVPIPESSSKHTITSTMKKNSGKGTVDGVRVRSSKGKQSQLKATNARTGKA